MPWETLERVERIGSGAFGIVYLANHLKMGVQVAVKCVPLNSISDADAKQAMCEVAILRNLSHPNVIQLLDCFVDEDSCLCLVMEYVDAGDLGGVIRDCKDRGENIPASLIIDIAHQILDGLTYLHGNNVLHRDIKPANIFLSSSGLVKIGDFGVSKLLSLSMPQAGTFIGTPSYVCPELCMGGKYSFGADVWALGVLLYEMFVLRVPFQATNLLALIGIIVEGNFDREGLELRVSSCDGIDERLVVSLIESMMVVDPFARPSSSELLCRFFPLSSTERAAESKASSAVLDQHTDLLGPAPLHICRSISSVDLSSAPSEMQLRIDQHCELSAVATPRCFLASLPQAQSSVKAPASDGHDILQAPQNDSPAQEELRDQAGQRANDLPSRVHPAVGVHFDPAELEHRIREKALLYHRKRLQAEAVLRKKRDHDESKSKPKISENEAAKKARQLVRTPQPPPTTPVSDDPFVSGPQEGQKIKSIALAIAEVLVEEQERRDAQEDDEPETPKIAVDVHVPRLARTVQIHVDPECRFRRLGRTVCRSLASSLRESMEEDGVDKEPPDVLQLQLTFTDGDGDRIFIGSETEWRWCVEEHQSAGQEGQPLAIRCDW